MLGDRKRYKSTAPEISHNPPSLTHQSRTALQAYNYPLYGSVAETALLAFAAQRNPLHLVSKETKETMGT